MDKSEIQKFIDEDINPALAMHGGHLTIDKYDEEHRHLYLRLGRRLSGMCCISHHTSVAGSKVPHGRVSRFK